ncbi:MAG TPA: FtsX-like permease family protein [Conexibacter sp.]|nr:FtsX-like permease family protein [Conexibacter sp.]
MLALTLRGIATRKLRTALTAFAVVLGIALVSGTYLLTDTINSAFDEVFQTANKGVDVVVTPARLFGTGGGGGNQGSTAPAPLPASVLERIRRVPGVAFASGSVQGLGQIYDKHDKPIVPNGPPMFIFDVTPKRFDPFVWVAGRPPAAAEEVTLDKFSADRAGYKVGDAVKLSGQGPQERFRLSGIAKFGTASSLGGAAIAIVTRPTAERLLNLHDQFTTIDVAADRGTTPTELATAIRAVLPASVATVRTGAQQAASDSQDIKDNLSFLRTFLFVFAGIALFVGAFLIANTFSITVAQRTRELALLRMIGASARQVLRAVVGEALAIGLLASAVGLLAGFGIAPGLQGLFSLFGADVPSNGIVVESRTIVVSLLLGTLITVLSALGPALRATRVPPMAAMQESAALPRGRAARWRTPLASAVAVLGVVILCLGLFGSATGGSAAGLVGAGAAIVFIGVGLLASHVVRPIAYAVGAPLERLRGVGGRLARENAARNPRRTAATSAALMIGVALVAFMTIFAAGLKASIANAVDAGLRGQLVIQSSNFQEVPASARGTLASVPGVTTVSGVAFSKAIVAGKGRPTVSGVDPDTFDQVFHVNWVHGSPASISTLAPGQALVAKRWAQSNHVAVGDRLALTTPTHARLTEVVTGVYDDRASTLGQLTLPNAVLHRFFNVRGDAFLLAATAPGADVAAVKDRAAVVMRARYPSLEVQTKDEFVNRAKGQVNRLLALIYVLLALALLISLFGIVNTLVLAIHERTRELGMLRAIGTSRRQVRQIVRFESVITAMIGAVLGVALGAIFAVLVTIPLESDGYAISIPVAQLIVLLVLAAIFGVVAAIWPARRAAKLDVLQALAYE